MKQQVINGLKVIVIGLVLSAGISYAGNWVAPVGPPPGNNAQGPINVGTTDQVKNGGLAVNHFLAFDNGVFTKDLYVRNLFNPANSGDLYVEKLANSTGEHVCAGTDGKLFLCGTPPPATTECNDGIDNGDPEDTLVDLADPGCTSSSDNSEDNTVPPPTIQCSDGIDNDADGLIDHTSNTPTTADPGCTSSVDNDEANIVQTGRKKFENPGVFTWTPTTADFFGQTTMNVTYHIWGGGGGGGGGGKMRSSCFSTGGAHCNGGGGGGGGGGYRTASILMYVGNTYNIVVGAGGAGGLGVTTQNCGATCTVSVVATDGQDGVSSGIQIPGGGTFTATGGKGGKGGYSYFLGITQAQISCTSCGGAGGIPNAGSLNYGDIPFLPPGIGSTPRGGHGGSSGNDLGVYAGNGGSGGPFSTLGNGDGFTSPGYNPTNFTIPGFYGKGGGGGGGILAASNTEHNDGGNGGIGRVEFWWTY